jgi:putative FmdB family regulatory protein
MPTYEFHCNSCNETFSEIRSFAKASEPATCPNCQGSNTQKVFNTITVFAYDSTAAERKNFPAKLARENQHTCSAGHFGGHSH